MNYKKFDDLDKKQIFELYNDVTFNNDKSLISNYCPWTCSCQNGYRLYAAAWYSYSDATPGYTFYNPSGSPFCQDICRNNGSSFRSVYYNYC